MGAFPLFSGFDPLRFAMLTTSPEFKGGKTAVLQVNKVNQDQLVYVTY